MELGIEGRPALVTGGGRGIGRAVAVALAREGAPVGVLGRTAADVERSAELVTAVGGRALPLACDLADPEALGTALARFRAELGEVQLVVHCAATYFPMAKLAAASEPDLDAVVAADLAGPLRLLRRVLPDMMGARHGRVVLLSSTAAELGAGASPAYVATKAALEGLVRSLTVDYARYGITANAVRAAFVDTERLRARATEEVRARYAQATPARRLAAPEEVANVVVFLCSDAARFVSGAVVPVTGGAGLNTLW